MCTEMSQILPLFMELFPFSMSQKHVKISQFSVKTRIFSAILRQNFSHFSGVSTVSVTTLQPAILCPSRHMSNLSIVYLSHSTVPLRYQKSWYSSRKGYAVLLGIITSYCEKSINDKIFRSPKIDLQDCFSSAFSEYILPSVRALLL